MGNELATQLRQADYLPRSVPQRVLLVSVANAASKHQRLLGRSACGAVAMPVTGPKGDVHGGTTCTLIQTCMLQNCFRTYTVSTCEYLSQEVNCFHQAGRLWGHTGAACAQRNADMNGTDVI